MLVKLEVVEEIARQAGEILLQKMREGVSVQAKGAIDLVTDADLAAEEFVVGELSRRFPQHGILAEEGGRREGTGDYLWVIDPVDGTTNFAHGFPYFCTSLALVEGGEVILGVVYDPIRGNALPRRRGEAPFSTAGAWLFPGRRPCLPVSWPRGSPMMWPPAAGTTEPSSSG